MQLDDGLFTRATAMTHGYTDSEIVGMCRRGELRRVANGIYVPAAVFDGLEPKEQHVVRARAASLTRRGSVASHQSAAAVHGLDLWDTDLTRVHLTVPGSGYCTAEVHLHGRRSVDRVTVDGIFATSLSRTVLDCARTLDFEHAVVIGDSALRVDPGIGLDLSCSSGQTGIAAARRAVAFMNGLSESPGESLSRIRFRQYGIPPPILQYRIPGTNKRVDFYWHPGVVGEFDGMAKYGGRASTLAHEKIREDDIRDRGNEVFRWTWRDLFEFDRVVYKYEQAVRRADRRR